MEVEITKTVVTNEDGAVTSCDYKIETEEDEMILTPSEWAILKDKMTKLKI